MTEPGDLHTREWGRGDRVAVLVHGMSTDSRDWWQVAPQLVEFGYRVVGVDLPGHGGSPAAPDLTVDDAAEALARVVPPEPELVVGHSLGGLVLAAGIGLLVPQRAVYVDVPFVVPPAPAADELAVTFADTRSRRTPADLRAKHPRWDDQDIAVVVASSRRWDIPTSVSMVRSSAGRDLTPSEKSRSLVIRTEPSHQVKRKDAKRLRTLGFEVRAVGGAGHTVWFGHCDEFLTVLDGWL